MWLGNYASQVNSETLIVQVIHKVPSFTTRGKLGTNSAFAPDMPALFARENLLKKVSFAHGQAYWNHLLTSSIRKT